MILLKWIANGRILCGVSVLKKSSFIYLLIYSNDVTNHGLEQEWILSVIKDGLKDELDYAMMQQNFILKMIMSFKGSSLCQPKSGSLILDIVKVRIRYIV